MPSWAVHSKVAEMLGISAEDADAVNRLIDAGILHDIGRRLPNLGLLDSYYLKIRLQSGEKQLRIINTQYTLSRPGKNDAFFLHHALDLLSLRVQMISAF